MLTVWKRITKTDGNYTHVVKVEVSGKGDVHFATWYTGPRGGGGGTGTFGLTKLEFEEVAAAVAGRLCFEHKAPGVRLYPGADDVNGYGCRTCELEHHGAAGLMR